MVSLASSYPSLNRPNLKELSSQISLHLKALFFFNNTKHKSWPLVLSIIYLRVRVCVIPYLVDVKILIRAELS